MALAGRFSPEAVARLRDGINLVRWGIGLNGAFGLIAWAGVLMAESTDAPQAAQSALAFTLFGGLFQFLAAMAALLGVCFCCSVPKGGRGRKWAQGVWVCLVVAGFLTLAVVSIFAAKVSRPGRSGLDWRPALAILLADLGIAVVVGSFFYCLLLVAVARFFGDRRLARSFVTCLVVSLAAVLAGVLGWAPVAADAGLSNQAPLANIPGLYPGTAVFLLLGLAVGLGLSLWMFMLVTRLYHLIPLPGEPRRPHGAEGGKH